MTRAAIERAVRGAPAGSSPTNSPTPSPSKTPGPTNPLSPTPDLERRQELLDRIVVCRAEHGLAQTTLRPMAAALDTSVTGLAGEVRADQIGVWRHDVEHRLIAEGLRPDRAALEASLIKATFSGLIVDLFATGRRHPSQGVASA